MHRPQRLFAVDGVRLSIGRGETLALVGESGSGSGKTTIARAVLGLVTPDAGQVQVAGRRAGPRRADGRVPFILQHPQASLDPRFRAWESGTEPQRFRGGHGSDLRSHALCAMPDLVIADEAVAALDSTTKLQILDLFLSLQDRARLPMLYITHDFAVVSRLAHRFAVMLFGRLLEIGPTMHVAGAPWRRPPVESGARPRGPLH